VRERQRMDCKGWAQTKRCKAVSSRRKAFDPSYVPFDRSDALIDLGTHRVVS